MPRGQHPNSRANLAGAAGGDRTAGKRLVIAAIAEALKTIEDDGEVRRFFRLGDGQATEALHLEAWAAVKAPRIYRAMIGGMRRALLGDYSAALTDAEKAEIDAQVQELRDCVPWDGTLSQEYLDDIAQELEWAEEDGATPEELAALEQELTEIYLEWMAEETPACLTPEEIKVRRRELIAAAKAGKKVALADMGDLKIAGFGKFWGYKAKTLYPSLATFPVPILRDSLDFVWLYNLGVKEGFGELPTDLTAYPGGIPSNEHVSWTSFFTSTDAEEPLYMERVVGVRPVWNYTVRAFFEGANETRDYVVNVFPGFVLARVAFTYQIVPEGLYGHKHELVSAIVVQYLDMPEAQALQAEWGRSGAISRPSAWGFNHLDEAWGGSRLYTPTLGMDASVKGLNDRSSGWAFQFERLGMDTSASEEAISAAFPRRERVGRAVITGNVDTWVPVAWLDWNEFMGGDGHLAEHYYANPAYAQTIILPPRYKPEEQVQIASMFSRKFIDAIQPDEQAGP